MKEKSILSNKYYLYITEFFSGMAVMAVELGANRLLAPYFSSSQIVWTIIIGTIMIAMALGNIYGGRTADKNPDPARLYRRILIAAVWIAAIPVIGKYIILLVSGVMILAINTGFLIWAALFSCLVIFVFPLFLLGTVTPSLTKFTVGSLDESGSVVGTLGAFNTIGSIIGTFLPTFVTIPAVGTSVTFLIFSGILLVLALIYFISVKKRLVGCIAAVVLFVLCSIFGSSDRFAFWENDLAYEGESIYNYLQVKDNGNAVILSTNVLFGVQSIHMKEGGLTGLYYDYALAAPVMAGCAEETYGEGWQAAAEAGTTQASGVPGKVSVAGSPQGTGTATPGQASGVSDAAEAAAPGRPSMLILGMGTGTFATQCAEYFPWIETEGVEIDEKITNLAHEYFYLDPETEVTTYDGRAFLNGIDKTYDIIMVDAYRDITIPFQMSSIEFFRLVKSHLKENGVLVMNMNMYSQEEGSITDYLADTVSTVFPYVYTVDVAGSTNRELFASENPALMETLDTGIAKVQDERLRNFLGSIEGKIARYEPGALIFTDDKAPVELLGMQVIDELIRAELGYYKGIFERDGIAGLIEAF